MAGFGLTTGMRTDEGPGLATSRAHAGMGQGNGPPVDLWMEYILRQQQQQGGLGGVQQGCCGAMGHWVNRAQSVPVPPSSSSGGSSAMYPGPCPGLIHGFPIGQNGAGGAGVHVGHQSGCGFSGVDQFSRPECCFKV